MSVQRALPTLYRHAGGQERAEQRRPSSPGSRAMSDPRTSSSPAAGDALAIVHQTLLGESLERSNLLAFVADEDMRYVAVNRRVCEVLGYTRDELLQLRVSDVAVEASAPSEYTEMVDAGFRAGTTMLRAKNGDAIELSYFASETLIAGLRFYLSVGVVAE
jgi:PAS domain S-box-containing protein